MRDKANTKSEVGFREQFGFMNSNQPVATAYRPFPGLFNMLQQSRTGESFVSSGPSPSMPCDSDDVPDDPFTSPLRYDDGDLMPNGFLVPTVCVTPDTRIIDCGYHNFWVAVEVMADLLQPDPRQQSPCEDATSRSRQSSRLAEHGK